MENLFKGTKGEWMLGEAADVRLKSKPNIQIAEAYSSSDKRIIEYTTEDWNEAEANARLISAAPDLLEAAIKVWIILSDIPEEGMDYLTKRAVVGLRDAVNKAFNTEIEVSNE